MHTYPQQSITFILREIQVLEKKEVRESLESQFECGQKNSFIHIYVFRCGNNFKGFYYSSHPLAENLQLECVGRLYDIMGQLLFPELTNDLRNWF